VTSIMTEVPDGFYVGIDTHSKTNMATMIDCYGRQVGTREFSTTAGGHRDLFKWTESFGLLISAGIEGTGSWGTGITRYLQTVGVVCVEVNRPNRQHRRRHGKSDPADALHAARSVLSGESDAVPRDRTGMLESLRVIRIARRSAVKARSQALNQIRSISSTAPDELRDHINSHTPKALIAAAARWRPTGLDSLNVTKSAIRSLARRVQTLNTEINDIDDTQTQLVEHLAPPQMLAEKGVGPNTAADVLLAYGSNPARITNEASFAALCGVSPVDASSGLQQRHRLNRGGDRHANHALWRIIMVKLSCDHDTRQYMTDQLAQGKTKPEIIRQLKRYTARHLWKILHQHHQLDR